MRYPILAVLATFLLPLASFGQSIALGGYPDAVCSGDSILIQYHASGTFNAGNTFNLNLSDPTGSLAHFSIAGSSSDPNGAIKLKFPSDGTKWRVRVASSDPYTLSDTSRFLSSVQPPGPGITAHRMSTGMDYGNYQVGSNMSSPAIGFTGEQYKFSCYSGRNLPPQVNLQWQFDGDAQVTALSDSEKMVTYTTPGWKTVTVTAAYSFGCPGTKSWQFYVASCHPQIPRTARIVTGAASATLQDTVIWVKSGGTLDANSGSLVTIFAEPGSVINLHNNYACYAKPGASISPSYAAEIMVDHFGAGKDTFSCSDLQFDYTQMDVEEPIAKHASISISQNILTVHGEAETSLRIVDLLGKSVMHAASRGDLVNDLSSLQSGVYIAIAEAANERLVRRIAIIR